MAGGPGRPLAISAGEGTHVSPRPDGIGYGCRGRESPSPGVFFLDWVPFIFPVDVPDFSCDNNKMYTFYTNIILHIRGEAL